MSDINDLIPEGPLEEEQAAESEMDREQRVADMIRGQAELDLGSRPSEYPSHMVEEEEEVEEIDPVNDPETLVGPEPDGEIQEAQSEGLAQQVQAEGNREAYQAVTVQDVRDMVADLTAERPPPAEPTVRVSRADQAPITVDLANVPIGMTAEEYVRHYQSTGVLLTDSTVGSTYTNLVTGETSVGTSTGSITITTDGTGTATWIDNLGTPVDPMVKPEESEIPMAEIPYTLTVEEIEEQRLERKENHKRHLERKRDFYMNEMVITKDDLIIAFTGDDDYRMMHIDIEGKYTVTQARGGYNTSSGRRRRSSIIALRTTFTFDKNMNRLISERDGRNSHTLKKVRTRRDGIRIYESQVQPDSTDIETYYSSFIVVNKNELINSRGGLFKVKYKQDVLYRDILHVKKSIIKQFAAMEILISFLKFNIEMIHDAEDYDIMYNFSGPRQFQDSKFNLIFKFNNVVISNSIEMEHDIGDIMIKTVGRHYWGRRERYAKLIGGLTGTRLTFSAQDAAKNYQHSHLTSNMINFRGFCTGGVNYGTGDSNMNEHDIQEHIIKLQSFAMWESLEGGPHYKMEAIHGHGTLIQIQKNILGMERMVTSNYIRALIAHINSSSEGFNKFSLCFTLVNEDGVLKFVVDYDLFFRKFMEIVTNDVIKRISQQQGVVSHTYNSEMQTFHQVVDEEMTDPVRLMKKAHANMKEFVPIYMNGKYHRPRIVNFNPEEMLRGMVFAPEPNAMKEIAQVILYQLTQKLEEHGNTSENREESRVSGL